MRTRDGSEFVTRPYESKVGSWDHEDVKDILSIFQALAGDKPAVIEFYVYDSFGGEVFFSFNNAEGESFTSGKRLTLNYPSQEDGLVNSIDEFGYAVSSFAYEAFVTGEFGTLEIKVFHDHNEIDGDPLTSIKWFVGDGTIELIHNEDYSEFG